jgi:hypothetical protein
MIAPCGCAATAWWLSGLEPDDAAHEGKSRVGSTASDATNTDARMASEKKTPTDFKRVPARAAGIGSDAADRQQPHQANSEKTLSKSPVTKSESAGEADPLAEQVRSLQFDDPAEEASALAALRAAPAAHRSFLLRTMQASAAVRKQNEARTKSPHSSASGETRRGEERPDLGERSRARVGQLTGSQNAPFNAQPSTAVSKDSLYDGRETPRRHDPIVDPNAVAVIEVEPAKELPNVVRAVSHNASPSPNQNHRTVDAAQALPAVDPASLTRAEWQNHLNNAITSLESELARASATDRAALEARLRLLCLAAGRRDEALRSRPGTAFGEQEFWSKEAFGLAVLLDTAKEPDAQRRAAASAPHLRQAAERLGEIGGLAVKNLHFCTEVKGYGSFVSFPQDEFRLGQEVLLYCELENFHSKLTDKGYHTALKARYQVFDSSGNRVAEKDLGTKDEHCQNRRRDFFVPYFLWMPKQIPSGKYQLKLTLEDVHAGQTAEATIEFGIKDK